MSAEKPPPPGVYDAASVTLNTPPIPNDGLTALRTAFAELKASVLTVERPTPDEDGVYRLGDDRIGVNQEVSVTPLVVATAAGGIEFLTPDEADYRGARRIAVEAAQEEP